MLKILIVGILLFLFIGITSIGWLYLNIDWSRSDLFINIKRIEPEMLSIKEIQRITAQTNYHVTIRNSID